MIRDMKEKGVPKDKYFHLGFFRWSLEKNLLELMDYYKEETNGRDHIQFQEIINAETKYIFQLKDNLKGIRYHWEYASKNINQEKQINMVQKDIKSGFFFSLEEGKFSGILISNIVNLNKNTKIVKKSSKELIPKLIFDLFKENIEYNAENEFSFKKDNYEVKIKCGVVDLNIINMDFDEELAIYNGKVINRIYKNNYSKGFIFNNIYESQLVMINNGVYQIKYELE